MHRSPAGLVATCVHGSELDKNGSSVTDLEEWTIYWMQRLGDEEMEVCVWIFISAICLTRTHPCPARRCFQPWAGHAGSCSDPHADCRPEARRGVAEPGVLYELVLKYLADMQLAARDALRRCSIQALEMMMQAFDMEDPDGDGQSCLVVPPIPRNMHNSQV